MIVKQLKRLFKDYCIFFLILILGIFLRVWHIDSIPPGIFIDEFNLSLPAARLSLGIENIPLFGTGWYGTPGLFFHFLSYIFKIVGISVLSFKLIWVVFGLIALPIIYFLTKSLFKSSTVGMVSMFLLATSVTHFHISRWGHGAVMSATVYLVSVYFLWLFVVRKAKNRWVFLLLSGLVWSFGLYVYVGARSFGLGFGVFFLLFCLVTKEKIKTKILAGYIFFMTMAVLFSPFLLNTIKNPNEFWLRMREVSIVSGEKSFDQNVQAIVSNSTIYAQSLVGLQDGNLRHNPINQPFVPVVINLLAVFGLAVLFYKKKFIETSLIMSGFVGGIAGGLLSIEAPSYFRILPVLPFIFIPAAYAINFLIRFVVDNIGNKNRAIYTIATMVVLLLLMAKPVLIYFTTKRFASEPLMYAFTRDMDVVGQVASLELKNGRAVFLSPDYLFSSTLFYGLPNDTLDSYRFIAGEGAHLFNGNSSLIVENTFLGWSDFISAYFPGSTIETIEPRIIYSPLLIRLRNPLEIPDNMGLQFECRQGNEILIQQRSLGPYSSFVGLAPKHFQCIWTGWLKIDRAGPYVWRGMADDRNKLQIFKDGQAVLQTDYTSNWESTLRMDEGWYELQINYESLGGASKSKIEWIKPGKSKYEQIDPTKLFKERPTQDE